MIFHFAFLSVVAIAVGQHVGSCGSEAAIKYARATVRPASIKNNIMSFPTDAKTAEEFCKESREAITTMRDFGKKCLKEMPKQGNSVAAFGFNKVIRKTCKDQESRKELYENLSCFNPVATAMRKQLDLFRLDMVRATFLQDNSLKIVAACCTYFNRSTALTNTGRKVCDQRKTEYLDSFMRGFAGDILDLICFGMTPESQKCRSLVLPPVEVTNRVPYVESFVPALLELMSSM